MKKLFAAVALLVAALGVPSNAAAALPSWNLAGTYTVEFVCTSVCTSTFVHTMTITSSDPVTGAVVGTGFYNDEPSADWTVTGTVSGADVSLDIEWSAASGLQDYNPLLLTGTVNAQGAMSGTATDAGDGTPRTFSWQTTAGAATAIERVAPSVSTFTAPGSPTAATTLNYTLTFSEPVTGLAAGDFTRTGTATGCASPVVSGSGSSYGVAISGCLTGTVILTLESGSVTDAVGNAGPTADRAAPTVTVDKTGPAVTSFSGPASPTAAATLPYTITFNESATGLAAGDFSVGGTATGCTVGTPTGGGTTHAVDVTGCSNGTLVLTLESGSVTDTLGNAGPTLDVVAATVTIDADRTAPVTSALAARPTVGASVSGTTVPLTVTWAASDAGGSGIVGYDLERSTNGGTWTTVSAALVTMSTNVTTPASGTVQYRVRARDGAGNVGAWATGVVLTPRLTQQTSSAITWTGTWGSTSYSSFSGGSAKYSTIKWRAATYRFTGRSIALVTTRAASRGKASIYVNGVYQGQVDLYRASTQWRAVVWQQTWSTSATRTVKIVVMGTSGRPRVDIDAFVVVK